MKLPTWTRTESTQRWSEELPGGEPGKIGPSGEVWTETIVTCKCDDPSEMDFSSHCTFAGFNLPAFDTWLATRPESEGKTMLLETRALAKAAASYWELRARLEVLHLNRQHAEGVAKDAPLLALGEDALARPSNGGKKSAETKQQARDERKAAAVAHFRKEWWPGSNADRADVVAAMVRSKQFGGESTVRDYLKDELRKARGKPVK